MNSIFRLEYRFSPSPPIFKSVTKLNLSTPIEKQLLQELYKGSFIIFHVHFLGNRLKPSEQSLMV